MINIIRTDSSNSDFIALIGLLDKYLQIKNGDDDSFFAQFNKIDKIQHVVVAYSNNIPVGCGAIKKYSDNVTEVKRMFVLNEFRGKGIATAVLNELEAWAQELGFSDLILETGNTFYEAIGLYQKKGYKVIPNYGQYEGVEFSVCMQKNIKQEVK